MDAEKNPLSMQFGRNLRRSREPTGMSQETLGTIAGLHRTEVSLLERGVREPRLGTIVKLAGALSIPIEQLLAGIDWKFSPGFEINDPDDVSAE